MNLEARPRVAASVTGDFVLTLGPDRGEWLSSIPGFDIAHDDSARIRLAVRGPACVSVDPQGSGWVALADLVEGDLTDVKTVGPEVQRDWRGRFAQVAWDADGISAFTDHFGSVPIYWYREGQQIAVASDLRLLLRAPWISKRLSLQAIYHYLNFSYIPAPLTICHQIRKLEPGSRLRLTRDREVLNRYYSPSYPADLRGKDNRLARDLRDQIVATVRDYHPDAGSTWGCFLSGGTDSSSVVTILARDRPDSQVQTCSIGFTENEYDELEFSRLAASRCSANAHFDIVDRMRATSLIDSIVESFDQPFGNASAIPTLACAELGASKGLSMLLAGDGGDEIFGGNQRYAKDRVMGAFHLLPSPVRHGARRIGRTLGGGRSLLFNRMHNFVERASLPNPDRFYTDDSFASDHYQTLLTPEFREVIACNSSLEFMRDVYACDEAGELNRIMRLDLLMAIAQNDLVKVHSSCKAKGISVRFPLLDPRLVSYTGRLQEHHKLRGLDKRHLFKRAMADVLPREILRKQKQGFGLPIAVWLRRDPIMQSMARSILLDQRTRQRGWIQPACVELLLEEHISGAWDYSAEIWQLLILELWLRRTIDEI